VAVRSRKTPASAPLSQDGGTFPQRFNPTPFKIFLPEKRPFFLKNSGTFLFGDREGTRLFFSRLIGIDPNSGQQVPLDVGAKLTGSSGRRFGIRPQRTCSRSRNLEMKVP